MENGMDKYYPLQVTLHSSQLVFDKGVFKFNNTNFKTGRPLFFKRKARGVKQQKLACTYFLIS